MYFKITNFHNHFKSKKRRTSKSTKSSRTKSKSNQKTQPKKSRKSRPSKIIWTPSYKTNTRPQMRIKPLETPIKDTHQVFHN